MVLDNKSSVISHGFSIKWNHVFFLILLITLTAAQSLVAKEPSLKAVEEESVEKTIGLTAELISETPSIKPSSTFRVGLKIKHDPTYHTYWKNPGVIGIPTAIKWTLPEGFKASSIQWPYPELTKMAAYPCYGYERDILLMVTITAPAKINTKLVKLEADINWMCCSEGCYPAFKKFHLTLPVISSNDSAQSLEEHFNPEFRLAEKQLVVENHQLTASMISKPSDPVIKLHINTSNYSKLELIHLFNSDRQTSPDLHHSITPSANGGYLYTTTRSEFSPKKPLSFPFVLQTSSGYFELNPSF